MVGYERDAEVCGDGGDEGGVGDAAGVGDVKGMEGRFAHLDERRGGVGRGDPCNSLYNRPYETLRSVHCLL